MNVNGGPPPCPHAALRRLVARRLQAGISCARAEGTEGWCEECRAWVALALPEPAGRRV